MASGYLLDTTVVSETRKTRPAPGVSAFLAAADEAALFVSVLTLGELRRDVAARRRTDAVLADRIGTWVDGIEATFADRVLPIDPAVARIWGELSASRAVYR